MQYFWGPDTYAARQAIEAIATRAKARIRFVDRQHLEEGNIADIVGQQTGLFGPCLVVVRDPSALPKALQEDIAAYVASAPSSAAWVLWDQVAPDKRSRLWRALRPFAREFPVPEASALANWLRGRAADLGGTLVLPAAQMLVARAGPDRWRLENELKRLLVMTGEVSVPLVEQEVAVAEQAEIFALLDALGRGEADRVIRGVQALLAAGHSEFYILSMLGYQFRTLLLVRAGLDQGQGAAVIAGEGKLHPYVVEKNIPVAKHLSYARWRDSLTRILATDFSIKQGRVEARTGLLMLILTLVQSMPSAPVRV